MNTDVYKLRDKIKSLNCYKKFTHVQQKIVCKKNNLHALHHSLNVIKNIGYHNWERQTKSMYLNQIIIEEINKL